MFLDRIKEYFKHNGRDLKIFLLSLLLAFSIWMIYNLTLNYTKLVSVPLVAVSNISGHKQLSSNSAVVLAKCHTRGFNLLRIENASEKDPIRINIAPSDLHPKSEDIFYITAPELLAYSKDIFGDDAGIETIVTDSLFFRFASENSKKVPVRPVVSMNCLAQYMPVGGLKLEPDSVMVYGESAYLDKIDRVYTRSFELRDLKNSVHGEVKLETIKGVRLSHDQSEYMLDVQRFVEIPAIVPIYSRNVPSLKRLDIYPSSAKVLFKCAFPVSAKVEDVQFYIDYNDFSSSLNGICIPQTDVLPAGVLSYTIEPDVFECVESDR